MGRAGPVGEAAPQTRRLPHPDLQADPDLRSRRAGPGPPNVDSGPSRGAQLPAGPGLPPYAAPVLLHHGARPAGATAPEGHAGSGSTGEAEVDELAPIFFILDLLKSGSVILKYRKRYQINASMNHRLALWSSLFIITSRE